MSFIVTYWQNEDKTNDRTANIGCSIRQMKFNEGHDTLPGGMRGLVCADFDINTQLMLYVNVDILCGVFPGEFPFLV